MEVEHGTFTPLIFTVKGVTYECDKGSRSRAIKQKAEHDGEPCKESRNETTVKQCPGIDNDTNSTFVTIWR